jgi:deazaflavin-dependent oxidoreductase (nitroreductase family)
MNRYERFVRWLGTTRLFAFFGRFVLTPIDKRMHGHRTTLTTLGTHFPLCYLTTTGRRTGEPHTTPLLVIDGPAGWMVAATNFGGPTPAWALNLRDNPGATFERSGHTYTVVARRASDQEKTDAWSLFDDAWPAFAAYRRRAGRDVDVFVLDPVDEHGRPEDGSSV